VYETSLIIFLMSLAGYIRKDQIRNPEIREELSIFNFDNIKQKIPWF
jgi:hypothetical protein